MQGKNIKAQIIKHYQYLSDRVAFVMRAHDNGKIPRNPFSQFHISPNCKDREDWQGPMFTGMAKYLYETDEQLRFCVDAIADFARSGSGCSGGNHGSIFFDEEASAIKNFITHLAEIAAARLCRLPKARTTIKNVVQWLVWVAKEIGKLTDMELHRADSEVNDIVDGKYDWRIEKLENHNGLMR